MRTPEFLKNFGGPQDALLAAAAILPAPTAEALDIEGPAKWAALGITFASAALLGLRFAIHERQQDNSNH